jgi:hypothetical protein
MGAIEAGGTDVIEFVGFASILIVLPCGKSLVAEKVDGFAGGGGFEQRVSGCLEVPEDTCQLEDQMLRVLEASHGGTCLETSCAQINHIDIGSRFCANGMEDVAEVLLGVLDEIVLRADFLLEGEALVFEERDVALLVLLLSLAVFQETLE